MAEVLLKVEDLATHFPSDSGEVHAVDGIDFEVRAGETLGIVGESGCGKSVTALSIMRLITKPGYLARGRVLFEDRDLATLSDAEMRDVRGNDIAMIFQEPMTSLNPVYTVGDQIAESICLHLKKTRNEAREMTIELFRRVGIPVPEKRIEEFPHQLSGGMRQRVMIAMALACNPKLLIADEPTTALDVTIQAQILDLMRRLRQEFGMSIIIITHDLGVVAEMADRVAVMYAGNIVETADVRSLFRDPHHPYTEGLLRSIPRLDQGRGRLHVIPGQVPNMLELPQGCRFQDRCSYVRPACRESEPELIPRPPDGRLYRCIVPPAERKQEEAS